jgi:Zn-dependent metalloprotease
MSRSLRHAAAALGVWLLVAGPATLPTRAQATFSVSMIAPDSVSELRQWGTRLDSMRRSGELRVRQLTEDRLVADREHERFDQYYRGVRVFGGDVRVQSDNRQLVSMFGTVYEGLDLETDPAIGDAAAVAAVRDAGAFALGRERPELVILAEPGAPYRLTWRVRAMRGADVREYFVDAQSGRIALDYSDLQTQAAIGVGTGVLGDQKKVSASSGAGGFVADDRKRPNAIRTYDYQGDVNSLLDFLFSPAAAPPLSRLATDGDNTWTDTMTVDAHVYAGWTHDYYFKRFGRHGLNDANLPIMSIVHPVRRSDVFTPIGDEYREFFDNAGYYGGGLMIYGVGFPPGVTAGGRSWDYTSGALDVVAHELSHGVTDYTSDLIYRNESGALNEAFSDIMATSIEFYFQQAGGGNLRADYLCAEDVVKPSGIRSLADPRAYGHPDHYSIRFTGTADNGGVHINSGIANHAFYLAIEGGTNRTSGLSVQGVGGGNREQMERVFYRAFTQLMPSNSTFATARAATIQAARDLFGANSAAERAVTEAWAAVGVN